MIQWHAFFISFPLTRMNVMKKMKAFSKRYRWVLIVTCLAGGLFYWYELRPTSIYRQCAMQASIDSRALIQSKADMAGDTSQGDALRKLIEKNLYLRTDYESFVMKCLLHFGYQIVPVEEEDFPADAVNTNDQ